MGQGQGSEPGGTAPDPSLLTSRVGERREQGTVDVGGETVAYELRIVDLRTEAQRAEDAGRGRPAGPVPVLVPGHGMRVSGPIKLLRALALLSRARMAWCVDPVPSRGGDPTEAKMIAAVVRKELGCAFGASTFGASPLPPGAETGLGSEPPAPAVLLGWSHGGGEALRAAAVAPDLFPRFVGLCPATMIERSVPELLWSFALEGLRTGWTSVRHWEWRTLQDAIGVGINLIYGIFRDAWRARSVRRVLADIGWVARKVPGREFEYPGQVVLLFGAQDTVVRWQDLFPDCQSPQEIAAALPAYQRENFPRARSVEVRVVAGNHVAPETHPLAFLEVGMELVDLL